MREKLGKLVGRRPFEGETDPAAAVERRQLVGAQSLQQAAVAGEHHGEENLAVEAGGRQEAQLGQDGGLHLLRLVGDEHRARQGGVDVRLPTVAQNLCAGPAVVGRKLDAEQIAQLAVEVGEARLRPADDADLHVPLGLEPVGENAQGDGLADAGRAGDESEAALADELLGAPAEGLDAAADVQGLDGHVGSERVPLEAVEGEHLPVHEASPSSSSLGR